MLVVLVSGAEVLRNGRKRTSSSLRTVDSGMNTYIPSDLDPEDVSCMLFNLSSLVLIFQTWPNLCVYESNIGLHISCAMLSLARGSWKFRILSLTLNCILCWVSP